MGYPDKCDLCVRKAIDGGQSDNEAKLSVRPFRGLTPYVMLVGRDPTLKAREARTVLELDNSASPIYKFIFHDILQPVGIKPDHIYATNLIKCTFLREPKSLWPYFRNCRKHFAEEIDEIKPAILISFGEIPLQLIVECYHLQDVDKNIREAFSKKYQTRVQDREMFFFPCIRPIAKRRSPFVEKWLTFIKNLSETVKNLSLPCEIR